MSERAATGRPLDPGAVLTRDTRKVADPASNFFHRPVDRPDMVRLVVLASEDCEAVGGDRPDVREVLDAASEIRDGLVARGFSQAVLRTVRDLGDVRQVLQQDCPDVIFNLVESLRGREAFESAVAALLERSGVEFTGSTAPALRSCLDKRLCQEILGRAGVPVPRTEVRTPDTALRPFPFPAFVKPRRTDGSVGIDAGSVVRDLDSLAARVRHLCDTFGDDAVVQEYLPGKEINVAVFGDRELTALWPAEIDFTGFPDDVPPIVTYRAKWDEDSREFTGSTSIRANLEPDLERQVISVAIRSFRALGLRDYGRVDLRLDDQGRPRVIEVNPNPDLAEGTGIARQAERQGMTHPDLVAAVAGLAVARRRARTQ